MIKRYPTLKEVFIGEEVLPWKVKARVKDFEKYMAQWLYGVALSSDNRYSYINQRDTVDYILRIAKAQEIFDETELEDVLLKALKSALNTVRRTSDFKSRPRSEKLKLKETYELYIRHVKEALKEASNHSHAATGGFTAGEWEDRPDRDRRRYTGKPGWTMKTDELF